MNYYRRYVGDYARDTAHLSTTEHGVYTLLLDTQYATEKPLPVAVPALCRICRAVTDIERAAVQSVVEQFFPARDGGRWNPRAQRELAAGVAAIDKMRNAGHVGARRRWGSDREPHREPHKEPDGVGDGVRHGVAIHPPSTIHHPPSTTRQPPPASHGALAEGVGVLNVVGARASRLHPTWTLPADWREWAMHDRTWTTDHVASVAERFRDYWIAKAGKDGRKVDWFATWRNWCRNDRAHRGNGALNKQEALEAHNADAGERWLRGEK